MTLQVNQTPCDTLRRMRVTSDIQGLDRAAPSDWTVHIHSSESVPSRPKRLLALARDAWRSDYLVLHFEFLDVVLLGMLTLLSGCRIVTLDLFIPVHSPWQRPLVHILFARVFRLLVYFRNPDAFVTKFGADPEQFQYIPFKINGVPLIKAVTPSDGGYVFSGGRSRRDFALLFSVMEELGYPCKVAAGAMTDLSKHGSSLGGVKMPSNVELLHNDRPEFFTECMAGARIVVIPLLKGAITQAGIGVYISAMALRKCVVISTGLGIDDVLLDNQAVVVPAGDRDALRDALRLCWEDASVRERYAQRGYEYAWSLGDADTLRRNIIAALQAM